LVHLWPVLSHALGIGISDCYLSYFYSPLDKEVGNEKMKVNLKAEPENIINSLKEMNSKMQKVGIVATALSALALPFLTLAESLITLPVDFVTDALADVSTLLTDFAPLLIVVIALPLFFIIGRKIVALFHVR
jgi:hypothetical protein